MFRSRLSSNDGGGGDAEDREEEQCSDFHQVPCTEPPYVATVWLQDVVDVYLVPEEAGSSGTRCGLSDARTKT